MNIIMCGPCGSGKSSVSAALIDTIRRERGGISVGIVEGDELHPPENIIKMSAGCSLTDEDRLPWLNAINKALCRPHSDNSIVVVTCSALKRSYREVLMRGVARQTLVVMLMGSADNLRRRMERREHFMPVAVHVCDNHGYHPYHKMETGISLSDLSLVDSQLSILESLSDAEKGAHLTIDTDTVSSAEQVASRIARAAMSYLSSTNAD